MGEAPDWDDTVEGVAVNSLGSRVKTPKDSVAALAEALAAEIHIDYQHGFSPYSTPQTVAEAILAALPDHVLVRREELEAYKRIAGRLVATTAILEPKDDYTRQLNVAALSRLSEGTSE